MSNGNVSDFELWSRFKAGDDIALSLIYEANSRKLYHYGLKFTGNVLLVEDSIQDLFTELIKNRRNLGDTFNISFYLLKSIKRKLLRKLMNEKRISMATPKEDYSFNVANDLAKAFYTRHKSIVKEEALEINIDARCKKIMTTKHCLRYFLQACPRRAKKNSPTFKEPLSLVYNGKKYPLKLNFDDCVMEVYNA